MKKQKGRSKADDGFPSAQEHLNHRWRNSAYFNRAVLELGLMLLLKREFFTNGSFTNTKRFVELSCKMFLKRCTR